MSSKKGITLEKARRTCVGACVGTYIPYETGHPVEGQPNLGKVLELAMNNGFDPRTKKQVGPKTGDPAKPSRTSRNCMRHSRSSCNSCEDTLRQAGLDCQHAVRGISARHLALNPDQRLH